MANWERIDVEHTSQGPARYIIREVWVWQLFFGRYAKWGSFYPQSVGLLSFIPNILSWLRPFATYLDRAIIDEADGEFARKG